MLRVIPFFQKGRIIMENKPSNEKVARINRKLAAFMVNIAPETDPQGMYTGVPEDPYEKPVQDADDL